MNYRFAIYCVIILVFASLPAGSGPAHARGVPFSFDSVWFYRDGTRVVPEISRRWVTVVFGPRLVPVAGEGETAGEAVDGALTPDGGDSADASGGGETRESQEEPIRKKARALVAANRLLTGYLYDPNLAGDACFFRLRDGLKPADIRVLMEQLGRDRDVRYVHPTLIVSGKTYAFFNQFEMQWKTGTPRGERESLLKASHALADEEDEKGTRYTVDVGRSPFFKALNLLAEDVRVLRVNPRLVEVKPTIAPRLSLQMNGGNIGDRIPFRLVISFSDRVRIDPSSIATLNLRPPELQKELFDCSFDPYDYAASAARSPIVITGRMAFYAPGEFTIPPVKIGYSCPSCPDNGVRSIETEPVIFRVASIIPKVKTQNRLMVPTDPLAPSFATELLRRREQRFLWLAIACFAGLVPCGVWAYRLRPAVGAARKRLMERRRADQLASRLRMLVCSPATLPHGSYLAEVGTLLREYLVARYGIDPRYRGGSAGRFVETLSVELPENCREPLSAVLTAIDTVVAREGEEYGEMEQLQRDTANLVDLIARNGAARG